MIFGIRNIIFKNKETFKTRNIQPCQLKTKTRNNQFKTKVHINIQNESSYNYSKREFIYIFNSKREFLKSTLQIIVKVPEITFLPVIFSTASPKCSSRAQIATFRIWVFNVISSMGNSSWVNRLWVIRLWVIRLWVIHLWVIHLWVIRHSSC